MAFLFSTFSSEDLEVFHSILRAAIRFQDTNAQVARKAMLITAMRGESALMQLAAMTERELAIRGRPVAPIEGESVIKKEPGTSGEARSSAPTPLEKAADDVVPRMVAYLKELFSTLFAFSFDVVGQTDKLPYAAALPHCNGVRGIGLMKERGSKKSKMDAICNFPGCESSGSVMVEKHLKLCLMLSEYFMMEENLSRVWRMPARAVMIATALRDQ
ncbi:hypothetical protein DFS34DRAFT_664671 [Phlyctochytrium arcticum]|nr:hypothetical protein DFS34DRAFT_664671 [Phlyctochytrium arcticum]